MDFNFTKTTEIKRILFLCGLNDNCKSESYYNRDKNFNNNLSI